MTMRISCDSNTLIAAIKKPDGGAMRAIIHIAHSNMTEFLISDYVVDEVRDVIKRKWPQKEKLYDKFLERVPYETITALPGHISPIHIADPKDQPIMDIISANNIDVYITNDNHFLDHAGQMQRPEIMALHDFEVKYFNGICSRPLDVIKKQKARRQTDAGQISYQPRILAPKLVHITGRAKIQRMGSDAKKFL